MTSFVSVKYSDTAVESIPCVEANVVGCEMHPVYGDKCFTQNQQAIHVGHGVKHLFMVEEVLLMRNDLAVPIVSTTDATIVAVDSLITV